MSKIKYDLTEEFDVHTIFNETVQEFREGAHNTPEIPLKFLFCFTAGVADAAYYLACCFHNIIGVKADNHEDLAMLMFNVSVLLDGKHKTFVVSTIKDIPQKTGVLVTASNIASWFKEGNTEVYIYRNLLADILDFDQNLAKVGVSLLKNINDSDLKRDFINIDGGREYLGFSLEDILDDLTGERLQSNESLVTVMDNNEAKYVGFVSENRASSHAPEAVELSGDDAVLCGQCVVS